MLSQTKKTLGDQKKGQKLHDLFEENIPETIIWCLEEKKKKTLKRFKLLTKIQIKLNICFICHYKGVIEKFVAYGRTQHTDL